jgi:hypothetical protein
MSETATSIRVVIPLTLRKRNGRPKILPPEDAGLPSSQGQDPHVLRAIARAWKWRRQLEEGEASTLQDIAGREGGLRAVYRPDDPAGLSGARGVGGAGGEAAAAGDFDQ